MLHNSSFPLPRFSLMSILLLSLPLFVTPDRILTLLYLPVFNMQLLLAPGNTRSYFLWPSILWQSLLIRDLKRCYVQSYGGQDDEAVSDSLRIDGVAVYDPIFTWLLKPFMVRRDGDDGWWGWCDALLLTTRDGKGAPVRN